MTKTEKLRAEVNKLLRHFWMTQSQLAGRSGVKRTTVGMFLKGKGGISFEHAMAIADVFQLDVNSL